ncbi:hypothetical protein TNCV_2504651 [Trichonephila clavipes]|uniref:Uncharacterized protein n=1 Tax=Trichonephila clavipes TaxID=2585209 RepID=A0A8X6WFN1_TRICX|nr:hypothetical protein TNCV_2504651 [Trichonephila clavipes]
MPDDKVVKKVLYFNSHWDSEAWKTKAEMGRLIGIRLRDYKRENLENTKDNTDAQVREQVNFCSSYGLANSEGTSVAHTQISGFKVHSTRGDKNEWSNDNPSSFQTEIILYQVSLLKAWHIPLLKGHKKEKLRHSNTPRYSKRHF